MSDKVREALKRAEHRIREELGGRVRSTQGDVRMIAIVLEELGLIEREPRTYFMVRPNFYMTHPPHIPRHRITVPKACVDAMSGGGPWIYNGYAYRAVSSTDDTITLESHYG